MMIMMMMMMTIVVMTTTIIMMDDNHHHHDNYHHHHPDNHDHDHQHHHHHYLVAAAPPVFHTIAAVTCKHGPRSVMIKAQGLVAITLQNVVAVSPCKNRFHTLTPLEIHRVRVSYGLICSRKILLTYSLS